MISGLILIKIRKLMKFIWSQSRQNWPAFRWKYDLYFFNNNNQELSKRCPFSSGSLSCSWCQFLANVFLVVHILIKLRLLMIPNPDFRKRRSMVSRRLRSLWTFTDLTKKKFTNTVLNRVLTFAGIYQKIMGIMKWGNIYTIF